jgi:hypothetical protein
MSCPSAIKKKRMHIEGRVKGKSLQPITFHRAKNKTPIKCQKIEPLYESAAADNTPNI